jgi:hypothetical protein
MNTVEKKRCTRCKKIKAVDEFGWSRHPGRKPYRRAMCQPCVGAYTKEGIERKEREACARVAEEMGARLIAAAIRRRDADASKKQPGTKS